MPQQSQICGSQSSWHAELLLAASIEGQSVWCISMTISTGAYSGPFSNISQRKRHHPHWKRDTCSERLSNFPDVTQLVNGQGKTWTQLFLFLFKPVLFKTSKTLLRSYKFLKVGRGPPLVVPVLRIHLAMPGDMTRHGANKPVRCNYRAQALQLRPRAAK